MYESRGHVTPIQVKRLPIMTKIRLEDLLVVSRVYTRVFYPCVGRKRKLVSQV